MSKESAHNSANEKLVDAVHEGIHDETDEETHGNTQDGPQEARQSPFPPLSVLTISSDGFAAPQLEKITDASEIKAHVLTDGPAAVDAETGTIPRAEHKIFILNGVHFAHACAAAAALDVDPAFIDAHLCRQRYVPSLSAHRRRQRAQCFHLDFPQLEKLAVPFNHPAMKPDQGILALELGYDAFPKEFVRPAAVDAMTAIQVPAPALVSVAYSSAYLRPYVLFQRVSWWRGSSTSRNSLLILDLDIHQLDYGGGIEIASHFPSPLKAHLSKLIASEDDLHPLYDLPPSEESSASYKESLLEELHDLNMGSCSVSQVLSAIAVQQWHSFVAYLTAAEIRTRESRLLDAAERSLRCNLAATLPDNISSPWSSLLDQVTRRRSLFSAITTETALAKLSTKGLSTKLGDVNSALQHLISLQSASTDPRPGPFLTTAAVPFPPREPLVDTSDPEARRSLERVSYMGAILLPFSIVAGLFSMAPDFAPGGRWFFAYWAASLPIAGIAVVLIYADILRKRLIVVPDDDDTSLWSSLHAGNSTGEILGLSRDSKLHQTVVRAVLEPAWSLGVWKLWQPNFLEPVVVTRVKVEAGSESGGDMAEADAGDEKSASNVVVKLPPRRGKVVLRVLALAVAIVVNVSLLGLPFLISWRVLRRRLHSRGMSASSSGGSGSSLSELGSNDFVHSVAPQPSPRLGTHRMSEDSGRPAAPLEEPIVQDSLHEVDVIEETNSTYMRPATRVNRRMASERHTIAGRRARSEPLIVIDRKHRRRSDRWKWTEGGVGSRSRGLRGAREEEMGWARAVGTLFGVKQQLAEDDD